MEGSNQAVITINGPGHDGTQFLLQEGITSFGRLPSNDVVLIDDLVSRNHARMTFFARKATLQDLGSHNGVYVNGERIGGTHALHSGDLCRIGPFQILYRWTTPAPPDSAPDHVPAPPRPSFSLLQQIEAARSSTDDHQRALQILLRASEALAAAPEVDDYIGKMLQLALDQTQATRGAYVEPKPSGLQVMQVSGTDGAATDAQVAPAVVDWAVGKNYPVKVDDLADDLRFDGPSQAVLCVPVSFGTDVLGALHLSRNTPPFAHEALDILVAVAHLTGLGIQASRARRLAVRDRLAKDTLERTFHPDVAAQLAGASADLAPRQATLLMVAAREWTSTTQSENRTRIGQILERFCQSVTTNGGRWHIGPGPTLFATFEDEAGPARGVTVFDDTRTAVPDPSLVRGVVARGTVLTGVTAPDPYRLPILAGPGLELAEALISQVPPGQVWLTETAARLYHGPKRAVANGAFLPT